MANSLEVSIVEVHFFPHLNCMCINASRRWRKDL